MTIAHCDMS